MLADSLDGLWTAGADRPNGRRYHLSRLDPRTGKVTATVPLGAHHPTELIFADGVLWAVCSDGSLVAVES